MGLYIKDSDVEQRLLGKVRFTNDLNDENKMSYALLARLVAEAESEVELELSPRYSAPFMNMTGGSFQTLPDRPTKNLLRTLCEINSVMRVLDTDFGRGSTADGSKYYENQEKKYKQFLETILKRRDDSYNQWFYPPLPGLMLNYQNEVADDGFAGQVLLTSQGIGGYAATQINDPSATVWNGGFSDRDF